MDSVNIANFLSTNYFKIATLILDKIPWLIHNMIIAVSHVSEYIYYLMLAILGYCIFSRSIRIKMGLPVSDEILESAAMPAARAPKHHDVTVDLPYTSICEQNTTRMKSSSPLQL